MLDRAFAHGVQAAWVTGDTVYGGDSQLRSWLEERHQPYVLAVPSHQRVGLTTGAAQGAASWSADPWQRLATGEGSQGPRWYDWAWQALEFRWLPEGWHHWLLARRRISPPDEIAIISSLPQPP
jgi:SRSO17 transposase